MVIDINDDFNLKDEKEINVSSLFSFDILDLLHSSYPPDVYNYRKTSF
jgi:hypothetical protein